MLAMHSYILFSFYFALRTKKVFFFLGFAGMSHMACHVHYHVFTKKRSNNHGLALSLSTRLYRQASSYHVSMNLFSSPTIFFSYICFNYQQVLLDLTLAAQLLHLSGQEPYRIKIQLTHGINNAPKLAFTKLLNEHGMLHYFSCANMFVPKLQQ